MKENKLPCFFCEHTVGVPKQKVWTHGSYGNDYRCLQQYSTKSASFIIVCTQLLQPIPRWIILNRCKQCTRYNWMVNCKLTKQVWLWELVPHSRRHSHYLIRGPSILLSDGPYTSRWRHTKHFYNINAYHFNADLPTHSVVISMLTLKVFVLWGPKATVGYAHLYSHIQSWKWGGMPYWWFRADQGSLVGSKPYCHSFSEKHHTSMSQGPRTTSLVLLYDYVKTPAITLSWGAWFSTQNAPEISYWPGSIRTCRGSSQRTLRLRSWIWGRGPRYREETQRKREVKREGRGRGNGGREGGEEIERDKVS